MRRKRLARLAGNFNNPTINPTSSANQLSKDSECAVTQQNNSKILQDSSNTSLNRDKLNSPDEILSKTMAKSDSNNPESSEKYDDELSFDSKSISKESYENKMEVDNCIADRTDIDSGIENMDIDNIDEKRENLKRQRDSSSSFEAKATINDEEAYEKSISSEIFSLISKIFAVNFSVNQSSYSGSSNVLIDLNHLEGNVNATEEYKNLIQFILMEVVSDLGNESHDFEECLQYFAKLKPENFTSIIYSTTTSFNVKRKIEQDSTENNFLSYRNRYILAFAYILDSYNRVFTEEKLSPEKYCDIETFRDLMTSIRNQCINYGIFILLQANKDSFVNNFILQLMYSNNLPCGFMSGLIASTYQSSNEDFKKIFQPILHLLWLDMQTYCSLSYENHYKLPLQVLHDLCNVAVGKSNFPLGELVSCNSIVNILTDIVIS